MTRLLQFFKGWSIKKGPLTVIVNWRQPGDYWMVRYKGPDILESHHSYHDSLGKLGCLGLFKLRDHVPSMGHIKQKRFPSGRLNPKGRAIIGLSLDTFWCSTWEKQGNDSSIDWKRAQTPVYRQQNNPLSSNAVRSGFCILCVKRFPIP